MKFHENTSKTKDDQISSPPDPHSNLTSFCGATPSKAPNPAIYLPPNTCYRGAKTYGAEGDRILVIFYQHNIY